MKYIRNFAEFISSIASPLLVPCYCIALALFTTYLYTLPISTRVNVVLVVFAVTVAVPLGVIYILYSLKILSDMGVNRQRERTVPYLTGILCYTACFIYLYALHAPKWLCAFILGGILAAIINTVVNMKWKISGHMAAAGCSTALVLYIVANGYMVYDSDGWLYGVIAFSGLVGWARLFLDRHTLGQVAAGFANGFVSTIILMLIS